MEVGTGFDPCRIHADTATKTSHTTAKDFTHAAARRSCMPQLEKNRIEEPVAATKTRAASIINIKTNKHADVWATGHSGPGYRFVCLSFLEKHPRDFLSRLG